MKIDVDLPKFDIPKDYIVGDGITGDILNMYGLFPCKIKAGVFAFCTQGTIRLTIHIASEYFYPDPRGVGRCPGLFRRLFLPLSGGNQFYPDDLQSDCDDYREPGGAAV